jgi:hypothetical protein
LLNQKYWGVLQRQWYLFARSSVRPEGRVRLLTAQTYLQNKYSLIFHPMFLPYRPKIAATHPFALFNKKRPPTFVL